MFTLDSPWRRIGTLPAETWRAEFLAKNSPMLDEAEACRAAAGPHGALALVQSWVESQYGTTGRLAQHRNPLGLRPSPDREWTIVELPDVGPFISFGAWSDAFAEWRRRLFDEAATYKDGVYARAGASLLGLIADAYAPASDGNNPRAYATSLARELTRLNPPLTGEDTMAEAVFGRVPHPDHIRMICDKPFEGAGFDRVPPRKIVGTCEHRTEGRSNIEFYHTFFSTGGERATNALVDYVVGTDGRIGMLNEPTGTRSPWANGDGGVEGNGVVFLQKMGLGDHNARLVSIEIVGLPRDPFDGDQFEAVAQLMAHWHDQAKVPWDRFPFNPKVGCVTDLQHFEFTGKGGNGPDECPGSTVRGKTSVLRARVKEIMRRAQTGVGGSIEPVDDELPNLFNWPNGYTTAGLKTRFGTLERVMPDGSIRAFIFDPTDGGVISNAWVRRGAKEKLAMADLPRPLKWWTLEVPGAQTRDLVVFERNWVLQHLEGRAGWVWIS